MEDHLPRASRRVVKWAGHERDAYLLRRAGLMGVRGELLGAAGYAGVRTGRWLFLRPLRTPRTASTARTPSPVGSPATSLPRAFESGRASVSRRHRLVPRPRWRRP